MTTLKKDTPVNGLGLGVDASGGPTYDPSANVIAIIEAANNRQDDLREAFERCQDREINSVKQIVELRALYEKEISGLRSNYHDKLSEAESKRIDAIDAMRAQASAIDREKQAAAATILANQVSISADALRTLVSTTASTIAEQSRIQMGQITDRLTMVERSQYEGGGKSKGGEDMWKYITMGISLLAIVLGGVFTLINMNGGV